MCTSCCWFSTLLSVCLCRDGFDRLGRDRAGFDAQGLDKYGYDREGYSQASAQPEHEEAEVRPKNVQGERVCVCPALCMCVSAPPQDGFDFTGYTRDGFDKAGYDRQGYDRYAQFKPNLEQPQGAV